jgi:hypothetical protein
MAKVKILNSCSVNVFNFFSGEVVEITKKNTDMIMSKIRHGTAVMLDDEEKKKNVDKCGEQNEDTNVLHDAPIRRPRVRRSDKPEGS